MSVGLGRSPQTLSGEQRRSFRSIFRHHSDDGGDMKVWYHARCMFETLQRARATTKKIESPADLEGFGELKDSDKDDIKQYIKG